MNLLTTRLKAEVVLQMAEQAIKQEDLAEWKVTRLTKITLAATASQEFGDGYITMGSEDLFLLVKE